MGKPNEVKKPEAKKPEAKKLEMKNNGKIDLLTESQTPSAFLRNIRKTIATIERGILKPEIAIATFRLCSECEVNEIKIFSDCIGASIRDSDYFARMSERGFWVVIHGNKQECELVIRRIRKNAGKKVCEVRTNILMRMDGEKREVWVHRVDRDHFQNDRDRSNLGGQ